MATPSESDDEMRPEYDFRSLRGPVRGKYAAAGGLRVRMIELDNDVAAAFADGAAVNEALREYLRSRGTDPMPS